MISFQELIRRLSKFWEEQGCIIHQGYDLEVGAGTMNPATFLRCLGPEPYRAAYVEPCRRPTDGRYGKNPNRIQHYFQFQVILKPSPLDMQEVYLQSLSAVGIDRKKHDIRFVHDDWENPTIGAWGLGWEVWMDGMEITQYTYFQSVAGVPVKPVTGELTYGIERLAMYLQNVDSIFDIQWNDHLTYGDIYHRNEVEWSRYNFEEADTGMWFRHFNDFEKEAKRLIEKKLPIPAYEFVMKSSHAFNLLDARGAISVTERSKYIGRIRELAKLIAEGYIKSREAAGYPLLESFPLSRNQSQAAPPLPHSLLQASSSEREDYLLEIGSEELPAAFVPIGINNLKLALQQLLEKEEIPFLSLEVYGTPRRLAALIKGLALGIPESTEMRRGPAIQAAFDSYGKPTAIAEGFLHSLGFANYDLQEIKDNRVPSLSIREVKGKEYLFASVVKPGRPTAGILREKLPALILSLDFPKKMRWSDLDISFPRPLSWIVSLFGKEPLPFQVSYLTASAHSFGHKQRSPASFPIHEASEYLATLKKHYVLADQAERKASIVEQLNRLEKTLSASIVERERVLKEVVYLTEWPEAAETSFDKSFLKAPKEVLTLEMVQHQRYFPVETDQGDLTNIFVITADTAPTEEIKHGNRKVLSSRLADGVFLYEKGLKANFEELNEKLKDVTFLSGVGTLHDKVLRLIQHVAFLHNSLGIGDLETAKRAALLSKADLVSEMVFEFPELQGTIGRYCALAKGEDKEVAYALEEQWMPRQEHAPLPATATGTLLSLADKLDNLIACFGAGIKPSSSSDPHALRRQALAVIKILIAGKHSLPLKKTLLALAQHFHSSHLSNPSQTAEEIEEFFINRIKTVFLDYDLRKDEIEAGLSNGFSDPYLSFCKITALHRFRQSGQEFSQLFEVFKRAKGQINGQQIRPLSETLLLEQAEKSLFHTLKETEHAVSKSLSDLNFDEAYHHLAALQPPLASLFHEVRILHEDLSLRTNRIALLQRVFSLFSLLLDFDKIQQD